MILRQPLLPCFLILFLASCGPAPASKGEKGEGGEGSLRLEQTADYLRVLHGEQAVLDYWLTPQLPDSLPAHYVRSGFIHPAYSPAGRVVTDDFPVGHTHQHGVFTAWTNTTFRDSFVDFWNTHKGLATVHHTELLETQKQDGIVSFKVRLTHHSLVHGDVVVLSEDLTVRVHDRNDAFVWDIRSEQTNVTDDTLFLNKHLYGGLGVRGSRHWNDKDTTEFISRARFLTSAGLTGDAANHTRPEWTAMYGPLPEDQAGLAVIPHPENFRWPQPVRTHPDMPYFSVSPVTEGGFFIAPGEVYLSRYRVVVFDGEVPERLLGDTGW